MFYRNTKQLFKLRLQRSYPHLKTEEYKKWNKRVYTESTYLFTQSTFNF